MTAHGLLIVFAGTAAYVYGVDRLALPSLKRAIRERLMRRPTVPPSAVPAH